MPDGRRAILSVSDKTGIVDFAKGIVTLGYTLLATDGLHPSRAMYTRWVELILPHAIAALRR